MFKKIKDWKIGDDIITLSLQISDFGNKQLFLNRQRKMTGYKHESGVEIPFEYANELALYLKNETTDNAYVKGTCDEKDIGKLDGYTFETIKKFILRDGKVLNLKLMYNSNETKLFLNRQSGIGNQGNERGVEISHTLAQEIALALREAIEKK